jgi:hypothetical protein
MARKGRKQETGARDHHPAYPAGDRRTETPHNGGSARVNRLGAQAPSH